MLFSGGSQVPAAANARATYDQYVANYRETVLTTFQSVEDQLPALRVLQHESEFQVQAVKYAQTAADVALNQFNAGTCSGRRMGHLAAVMP
jgi:outer membrane protein TolC